jgi:hypothetical protein
MQLKPEVASLLVKPEVASLLAKPEVAICLLNRKWQVFATGIALGKPVDNFVGIVSKK